MLFIARQAAMLTPHSRKYRRSFCKARTSARIARQTRNARGTARRAGRAERVKGIAVARAKAEKKPTQGLNSLRARRYVNATAKRPPSAEGNRAAYSPTPKILYDSVTSQGKRGGVSKTGRPSMWIVSQLPVARISLPCWA